MHKIIVSVHLSELELFKQNAVICNCFIISELEGINSKIIVKISSDDIVNFYELGYQFGAYSPTFISN